MVRRVFSHYTAQPIKAIRAGFSDTSELRANALHCAWRLLPLFLHFLGITDVKFVYAEGLAVSETSQQAGLAQAYRAIEQLGALKRFAVAA